MSFRASLPAFFSSGISGKNMDELNQNNPAFIAELLSAVREGGAIDWQRFARLTGTDETQIKKAWIAGRLPSEPHDRIPMREGVVALVSLGGLRKRGMPKFLQDADTLARELLGLPPREQSAVAGIPEAVVETLKAKLLQARAEASRAQAEKTKLETDIKKGVYVLRAEVELDAATTATQVSAALMQMPSRLAGMCAGLPAGEIANVIRDEVEHVVKIIQTAAFTGDWGDE